MKGRRRFAVASLPARGHIPFKDHRTQKEVREDEELLLRYYREQVA